MASALFGNATRGSLRPTGIQQFGNGAYGRYLTPGTPTTGGQNSLLAGVGGSGSSALDRFNEFRNAADARAPAGTVGAARYSSLYNQGVGGGTQVPLSGSVGGIGGLTGSFQNQLTAANEANEARYQEGLAGFDTLEGDLMSRVGQMGQEDIIEADRWGTEEQARISQDAVSRGIGNTTAPYSDQIGAGYQAERLKGQARERQLGRESDTLLQTRLGKLGFLERKNENAPDMNMLMALADRLGQGTGGGGTSSVGRPPTPPMTGDTSQPAAPGGTQGRPATQPPATAQQQGLNQLATAVQQMFPGKSNWNQLSPQEQEQFRQWAQQNMPGAARYLPPPSAAGGSASGGGTQPPMTGGHSDYDPATAAGLPGISGEGSASIQAQLYRMLYGVG